MRRDVRRFEGKVMYYASTDDVAKMVQLYGVCWLCGSRDVVAFDWTRPIGGGDLTYQNICESCVVVAKTLHGLQKGDQ